jgi:methyl-accepting chemotaxis protein
VTIKRKLYSALCLLGLTITLLSAAFYHSTSTSRDAISTILKDRMDSLADLKMVADSYAVLIVDTAHKVRAGRLGYAEGRGKLREANATIEKHWSKYQATEIVAEEATLAAKVEQSMVASNAATAQLDGLLAQQDGAALAAFVEQELYPAIDSVSEALGALSNIQLDIAQAEAESALSTARVLYVLLLVLLAGSAATLLLSVNIVARGVVTPIRELATTIRSLAETPQASVPGAERSDEIGDIANAATR